MRILFINASPHPQGSTARLAAALLQGRAYETLRLADYRLNGYGQELPGDQFDEVLAKIRQADVLVLGSPVYWHNLSGLLRTLLDRFYGPVPAGSLQGKCFLLFQGAAPEPWMLQAGDYTVGRFARMYGYTYEGMATNVQEAEKLSASVDA